MKDAIKQFLENQYPNTEVAVGYIHSGKAFFMGMQKKKGWVIRILTDGTKIYMEVNC